MVDINPFPAIIALGHQSRVGKDTAARAIIRAIRRDFDGVLNPRKIVARLSFAKKLKDSAHDLFGIYGLQPGEFYERPENEHLRYEPLPDLGKSPVDIWIEYGQAMRGIHAPIWIDQVLRHPRANQMLLLMIPDLRFPNEAAAVRARGGICVKVERPDNPTAPQGSDQQFGPDFEWDALLLNDGIPKLEARAVALARNYLGPYVEGR